MAPNQLQNSIELRNASRSVAKDASSSVNGGYQRRYSRQDAKFSGASSRRLVNSDATLRRRVDNDATSRLRVDSETTTRQTAENDGTASQDEEGFTLVMNRRRPRNR